MAADDVNALFNYLQKIVADQEWYCMNYMNPPYGRYSVYIKKAYEEYLVNDNVTTIPVNDTRWFHDYIYKKASIIFIKDDQHLVI